ncbi:MAG: DUF342 domain-containing protein [Desulfobacteraceae bacterium]|nr:MAG: DUF342 domain-containing protein [Desulfobacteraceae bacterium]
MDNKLHIPSIADLALQYGTIKSDQHRQIKQLFLAHQKNNKPLSYQTIMQKLRMATPYQLGLLELIQDYLIIRAKGEEFGKLAVEKGYASPEEVDQALEQQRKEFKQAKIKRLIGDILVNAEVITEVQKGHILKEQKLLEKYGRKILEEERSDNDSRIDTDMSAGPDDQDDALTDYEKQFLEIKAIDQEFGAIAVERGYASKPDISKAMMLQELSFKDKEELTFIGDILVRQGILTHNQTESILREQNRDPADVNYEPPLKIKVTENKLEAVAHLNRNINRQHALGEIKSALTSKGITYGIFTDPLIQGFIDAAEMRFTVAKQDFSLDLIKNMKASYTFNPVGISDQVKKKGETLAQQTISTEGYLKKDLYGDIIDLPSRDEFMIRCGAGTRLSNDKNKVFANKTGLPSLSIDKKFYIHPIINVLEDADLRYGPLEAFANLNISGTVTGAFPVKAGNLSASEIRGADIEAIGDVTANIGITDSVVRVQGNVKARYIHNSTILAFGDVQVDFEIMDSTISCSGRIKAEKSRVLSSDVAAKRGILIGGAGSDRTNPCTISSGSERHIVSESGIIDRKIDEARTELDDLIEKMEIELRTSGQLFQKMVELKIFHDKAKKKKEKIEEDYLQKKESLSKEKKKNIARLIRNFNSRIENSIDSLKRLNAQKKSADNTAKKIKLTIEKLTGPVEKKIRKLEMDRFAFFEWARKKKNICETHVTGKVFQGTIFKGIYATTAIEKNMENILVVEKEKRHQNTTGYELQIIRTD